MGAICSGSYSQKPVDYSQGSFTAHQKRILRETWVVFRENMIVRGQKVFLRIFEMNPKIKDAFGLDGLEGTNLIQDERFLAHATRFMQSVGTAVDQINDLEALRPLLLNLGRRHAEKPNFKPIYFSSFTEAMMFTWEKELGEKFTTEVAEAWLKLFLFIMECLKAGYQQGMQEKNIGRRMKKNSKSSDWR